MKFRVIGFSLILGLLLTTFSLAQEAGKLSMVLTGGDDQRSLESFVQAVISHSEDNQVNILVLPISLPSNSLKISPTERDDLLSLAETKANEIEYACKRNANPGQLCSVKWAPILGRVDANNPENLDYFTSDLDVIYILEGNPSIGLQVIGETPIQTAINKAFKENVVLAGSVPGLFSAALLQFDTPKTNSDSVFDYGSIDLFVTPQDQEVDFRLPGHVIHSKVFEPYQLGALIHAVSLPGAPGIGVGIDPQSGLTVSTGSILSTAYGNLPAVILDAHSYKAAQGIQYSGQGEPVSLRNVLVHVLSPGETTFDLKNHQMSISTPALFTRRNAQPLKLVRGEGLLFLSADLADTAVQKSALNTFVNAAGGQNANLLIIAAGYADRPKALEMNRILEQLVKAPAETIILEDLAETGLEVSDEITGIILNAAQAQVDLEALAALSQSWRSGIPVWLQGAAVNWAGASFINPEIISLAGDETGEQINSSFIINPEGILPGFNWLPVSIVTQVWSENHWSAIFSLAVNQPQILVIGIPANTGLEISELGARVLGEDVLFSLDLSQAELYQEENGNFQVANGLVDVFSPQEMLIYKNADMNADPIAADTPALPVLTDTPTLPPPTMTATKTPTSTSTPIPTATLRVKPTATIKPTNTPPAIPPPPDPGRMNTMVLITLVIVLVIFFGIWLNRRWILNHQDH